MGLELKVEQKQRVYQKQIEQARILQMNAQELAVCIPAGISRQKTGGLPREENRKVLLI